MILFDVKITEILNQYIANTFVDSVLIASYGLNFQFADTNIHCNERVYASIGGQKFEFDDTPNSSPWGNLVRQQVLDIQLTSPSLLKITFQSGDFIEIETVECDFESVVINLPSNENEHKMAIY